MAEEKIVQCIYEREDGQTLAIDNNSYMIPNDGIEGVNPDTWTVYSEELAFDEGSVITGASMSGRTFKLTFETLTDADYEREKLRAFFNMGKMFKATLTYRGVTRWVYGMPDVYDNPANNVYKKQTITIALFCEDPFWKSVEEDASDSASVIPRWGWPYQRTAEQNYLVGVYEFRQIMNLENNGDVPASIVIDIDFMGTVIEPVITDLKSREFYKLNESFSAGDKVHIDMKKGLITLNGIKAHNRISLQSSRLYIPVGGTTLQLSATSGVDFIHAFISYNQSFRGV